jgi:hypothetical protein
MRIDESTFADFALNTACILSMKQSPKRQSLLQSHPTVNRRHFPNKPPEQRWWFFSCSSRASIHQDNFYRRDAEDAEVGELKPID